MNIIILSGGSGKRLWPLTNQKRAKQFIKCLKREDGANESMLQRVYRQIRDIYPEELITVAANEAQKETIHEQIGKDVDISAEPCGRDTFAAIALATAYLTDIKGVRRDEPVVVCPSDFYGNGTFFLLLDNLAKEVASGRCDMALIGKEPKFANTEYGYILPAGREAISDIRAFAEKPDSTKAQELIDSGALWNCGVFAFKPEFVLKKMRELTGYDTYEQIINEYRNLPAISFDNAVVVKCAGGKDDKNDHSVRMRVVRYTGTWHDIGSWNSLTSIMEEPLHGKIVISEECSNVSVINELGIPILLMGMEDAVVAATDEGILVANKEKCNDIRRYLDSL
ncbi:MAG: mannose-1-phosphate guanylyltransferase [Lachnospiraceae bacterium]|nr:mannose-1-phosphate guanylyltransferase [Lachnospiraceae bacterium]